MDNSEERVWAYLRKHGDSVDAFDVSINCDVRQKDAEEIIAKRNALLKNVPTRSHNIGKSDYSKYNIQPWDIWLEYDLNPWDADIVKRVLREKPGERRLDYEKIKHICDERIRQIDTGVAEDKCYVNLEEEESTTLKK